MSIKKLVTDHLDKIIMGIRSVDEVQLQLFIDLIVKSIGSKTNVKTNVFVCGNGASASIAQHMACDYTKGSFNKEAMIGPRVISLNDNVAMMTAVSNDISYEEVFSYQLHKLANIGDVLIVISSSGNSPSVVKALETAEKMCLSTVAFTGFNGGICRSIADISIHVDVDEYEATEDCHQALMQIAAKAIRQRIKEDYV